MSEKLTREERVSKVGDIKCHVCKLPWDGQLCLDDPSGFQLYCEVCDLFIWMEEGFKIFVTLGNSGKALDCDADKLQKKLDKISKYSYELPKDHPINKSRRERVRSIEEKEKNGEEIEPIATFYYHHTVIMNRKDAIKDDV